MQLGAGVETEILAEVGTQILVGAQCFRLAAGAVEGEHQLAPSPFAQWRIGHRGLEFADDLRGPARCQQGIGPILHQRGMALDPAGNLYIADFGNSRVRKVTPGGTISTYAGTGTPGFAGDGGPATAAQLSFPQGVALDSAGNLYIADSNNNRIRKVTPGGTISTYAGTGLQGFSGDGGPAIDAQLWFPVGVALDSAGNLYIADQENQRIRKVTP